MTGRTDWTAGRLVACVLCLAALGLLVAICAVLGAWLAVCRALQRTPARGGRA